MSAICDDCLKKAGDVELYTRPFIPTPCIGCGKPTQDHGTPWKALAAVKPNSSEAK